MIKAVKLILLFFLLVFTLGFIYFVKVTGEVTNYSRATTDAIVIFGEKKQRLYEGVRLLKLGYAPLVFITGDKPKQEFNNFFKENKLTPEQFIFDTELAENSISHAADAAAFLNKYQLHSVRLIVGSRQLPRALLEIKSTIPSDVTIIPHTISTSIDEKYYIILQEYTKYTLMLIASFLGLTNDIHLSYS